jgi:hypothetical protein
MFEDVLRDIIVRPKKSKLVDVDLKDYIDYPRCVYCGSGNFKGVGNFPLPGSTSVDRMRCKVCSRMWSVTIDGDYNITKVQRKK